MRQFDFKDGGQVIVLALLLHHKFSTSFVARGGGGDENFPSGFQKCLSDLVNPLSLIHSSTSPDHISTMCYREANIYGPSLVVDTSNIPEPLSVPCYIAGRLIVSAHGLDLT